MPKPKSLHSVLDDALASLGLQGPMKSYSIWGSWKKIVGDSIASNAQPFAVRNQILFLEVSHPTWIQQLQFLKPTLLEKVNSFLGEPLVRDIRFRLGKIRAPRGPARESSSWKEELVDPKTLSRLEDLLQNVKEGETRETLRKVLTKGAKLERYRNNQR